MLELRYIEAPAPFMAALWFEAVRDPLIGRADRSFDSHARAAGVGRLVVWLPSEGPGRMAERQRRAFAAARARGGLIWQVLGRYQSSPIPWAGHSNRHGRRTGPGGEATD